MVALCECGCGELLSPTPQAKSRGPRRFVHNHHRRKSPVEYVVDENGCWVWQRSRSDDGYPTIGIGRRKTDKAHRVYYRRAKGEIPEGNELHHTCGNRGCVNPDHLEPLTRLEHRRKHPRKGEALWAVS